MPLSDRRRLALLLVLVGAVLTFMSRVQLAGWKPFSDAMAGLGFALGLLARSDLLWGSGRPQLGQGQPPPDALGPSSSDTKPPGAP